MALCVEPLSGVDKGWKFTTTGAGGVAIGRGPRHAIRLKDPLMPDGSIEIAPRPGGYLVTNNLKAPVYLDRQPLRPGESRTLHHGALLQPTASTLLRLGIVASPPGAGAEPGAVIREPPPVPPRGLVRRYGLWALVVAALAFYWWLTWRVPPVDAAAAGELKAELVGIEEKPGQPAAVRAELRSVRLAFTDAVYHDAARRPADAARCYREVRDALDRVARARAVAGTPTPPGGTADDAATCDAVARFTADRLKLQRGQR